MLTKTQVENLILKTRPAGTVLYVGSLAIRAVRKFTRHQQAYGLWRFWQMEYAVTDSTANFEGAINPLVETTDETSSSTVLLGVYDKLLFKKETEPPLPRAWEFQPSKLKRLLEKIPCERKCNLPYSCHEVSPTKFQNSQQKCVSRSQHYDFGSQDALIGDWYEYSGLSVPWEKDSRNKFPNSKSLANLLESPTDEQIKLQNSHFHASAESLCSWEQSTKYYASVDAKFYKSPWATIDALEEMGYHVTRIYPQSKEAYMSKLESISNPKLTTMVAKELKELEHQGSFSAKIPSQYKVKQPFFKL